MSYIKATSILPQELLEVIQTYLDGEYLYIPRKECNKKNWGENTKIRKEITIRNENIYEEFKSDICIKFLALKYCLSEKSIQRIILEMKKQY